MSKMSRSEAGKLGAEKTNKLWRKRYSDNPKHCSFCKEKLPYEKRNNKFCNHSCAASFNNTIEGRRTRKIPITQVCENCGQSFSDKKNVQKFCSRECNGEAKWKQIKTKVENGEHTRPATIKKYLLEERGVQCEICQRTKWCGESIPLVMDHIDGNSQNNGLQNLRLVCGNCDMQLPTYKSKNIGNGRHYRRVRYAEGKSF